MSHWKLKRSLKLLPGACEETFGTDANVRISVRLSHEIISPVNRPPPRERHIALSPELGGVIEPKCIVHCTRCSAPYVHVRTHEHVKRKINN